MIAALYVATGGCYFGLPDVEPWDEARNARLYAGPWPVVAHPPCERWCQQAPVNQKRYGHKVGDDGGYFSSALAAVRRWGGVLEHPALSYAWKAFGLQKPPREGWAASWDGYGSYVCQVFQRRYGHRARKATWLYVAGGALPHENMKWGPGEPPEAWISTDRPRAELAAMGIAQLGKREAKATPPEFRDLLLSIARSATRP